MYTFLLLLEPHCISTAVDLLIILRALYSVPKQHRNISLKINLNMIKRVSWTQDLRDKSGMKNMLCSSKVYEFIKL